MEHLRVKRFEGVYSDWDETDSERGSLRQVRGLAFGSMGALSSLPPPLLASGDIVIAAAGLAMTGPSLLLVTTGESKYIVSFNPNVSDKGITFIAPVLVPAAGTIPTTPPTITASVLATNLSTAAWFGSRCGEYLIMGNGVNSNYVYEIRSAVFRTLGSAAPQDTYSKAREVIPPCTSFVVNVDGVLFASGNPTNPNRVWVTDKPDIKTPNMVERVRSLSYAYVDLGLGTSTVVTGLSVVRDYIIAHIRNDRPVMLYAFDLNGVQGWRCRQVSSEFKSSAPNPGCAVDTREDSAYFLGQDGEIYRDATAAPASAGESAARSGKIITARGAGSWNESMSRVSADTRMVYHAREDMVFVLATSDGSTGKGLYVVNVGMLSYSGPFTVPASAMCVTDDALVLVVDGKLRIYEVAALGSVEFSTPSPLSLTLAQPVLVNPGVPTDGYSRVGVNPTALTFQESVSGMSYSMPSPFGKMQAGTPTGVTLWFNNARLSYFETGYEDFGDPASFKDFVEFHLTLRKNSVCAVGIVAETEAGVVRKNWRGLVSNVETLKAFFNMKGRRVRFRVYLVTFDSLPCAVLDYSIGWLVGVVK